MINCWDTNTVLYPSGKILFIPPCKMTSQCELSLRRHPYGNQECTLKFGSWTFDGNVLDVQFFNGVSWDNIYFSNRLWNDFEKSKVNFDVEWQTKGLDLSQLHNSSGFEVVSTTAQRNVKYYSCCPDPYPDLTFNVTIKRIPAEELFDRLQ